MKKMLLLIAMLSAGPAAADDFNIEVENFTAERGISTVVMKVTNMTGRDARQVFIDCVFLDGNQKAIDIGKALIPFIANGGSAYDKAAIPTTEGVQFAQCGVKQSN